LTEHKALWDWVEERQASEQAMVEKLKQGKVKK
jgi:hypothetical protein